MARIPSLRPRLTAIDTRTVRPPPKQADSFYTSPEWRAFRDRIVRHRGARCEDCGRASPRVFVDHIREIKDGGALLDEGNAKVLCGSCHSAKTAAARATRLRLG